MSRFFSVSAVFSPLLHLASFGLLHSFALASLLALLPHILFVRSFILYIFPLLFFYHKAPPEWPVWSQVPALMVLSAACAPLFSGALPEVVMFSFWLLNSLQVTIFCFLLSDYRECQRGLFCRRSECAFF